MVGVGVLAAGWNHVTPPLWSKALMFSAFALWAAFFVAEFFIHELPVKRRAFWSSWLGGCVLAALSLLHRGWATSVGVFAVFALAGVFTAIRYTPYFKIGGRVIAVHGSDRREGRPAPTPTFPRPVRDSTGPRVWWLFVGLAAFASLSVVASVWGWRAYFFGNLLLGGMALFGFDDGRQRFPILRRQYLQAALVTVVSIPLYGVPVLVYVAAYALGTRVPVRYSRHDAEARYYHEHDRRNGGSGPDVINGVSPDRIPLSGSGSAPAHTPGIGDDGNPLDKVPDALGDADAAGSSSEQDPGGTTT